MSMFASRTQKTIPIPFEPGQSVTIQKLAGRHLEAAARQRQIDATAFVRDLGGAEFRKQVAEQEEAQKRAAAEAGATATAPEATPPDPLNGYDLRTLLYKGVKSWTLPQGLAADAEGNIEALDDLSEEARDWLAREVLKLTKPSLFEDAAAREEAQVKDLSPSTAS